MKRALILVDLQNDFIPGGALAVNEGHEVVPIANRLMREKGRLFDLVVATQDWHPPEHGSFASRYPGRKPGDMGELGGLPQVLWPDHCVQRTSGADFASGLELEQIDQIFPKGTDPAIDSYSGFFDNGHKKDTGLGDFLKAQGVSEVYVLGLATDYCVKFTALDAVRLGFRTTFIEDGSRGVELSPGDVRLAVDEMRANGVSIRNSVDLLQAGDQVDV